MSSKELEDAISTTQQTLEAIFARPKCTSKLLTKPPFRFIFDIVTATLKKTGFPNQYFSQDSDSLKDKTSKIEFLDKLIYLVSVCIGTELDVRASKIVAGLDPIKTNVLLSTFGKIAVAPEFDHDAAIAHCLSGGKVGQLPQTLTGVGHGYHQETAVMHSDEKQADSIGKEDGKVVKTEVDAKDTTRLDNQIQECNSDIGRTQTLLHEIVSKPRCTEKLLGKPPFRFIHDVVLAVNKATSLRLEDVFSQTEMDSSKARDKDSKIAFLCKLISHVESILDLTIDLEPLKVIAGLEAEKTRYFFQLFVLAANRDIASQQDMTAPAKESMDDDRVIGFEAKERDMAMNHGNDAKVADVSEANLKGDGNLEADQDAAKNQGDNEEVIHGNEANDNMEMESKETKSSPGLDSIDDQEATIIEDSDAKFPLVEGDDVAPKDETISKPEAQHQQSISHLFFGSDESKSQDIAKESALVSARPKTARRRPSSVRDSEEGDSINAAIHRARPFVMQTTKVLESSESESDDEDPIGDENAGNKENKGSPDAAPKLRFHLHFKNKNKRNGESSSAPVKTIPYTLDAIAESIQNLARSTAPIAKALTSLPNGLDDISKNRNEWTSEYVRYEKEFLQTKDKSKQVLAPLEEEMANIEEEAGIVKMSIKETAAQIRRNDLMLRLLCGNSN